MEFTRKGLLRCRLHIAACCFVCLGCSEKQSVREHIVFNVPEVKEIGIDGLPEEWADRGLKLKFCTSTDEEIDLNDFHAEARLGWDHRGLYLLCKVSDDRVVLSNERILDNDCLEIFISREPGSNQMVQYMIPAGKLKNNTEFRVDKYDYRTSSPIGNTRDIEAGTLQNERGYTIEALIPLKELEIESIRDSELAVQLIFNDVDSGNRSEKQRYSWYYYYNTYINHNALHHIKLIRGSETGPVVPIQTVMNLIDEEYYSFRIAADISCTGQTVAIKNGSMACFSGELAEYKGVSSATGRIDTGSINQKTDQLDIYLDHKLVYRITSGEVDVIFRNRPKPGPGRFEYDIRLYELRNTENPPSDSAILFLGSSSIRHWSTLASDFGAHEIVQCGFGGSRSEDVLYYFDRIVKPYPYKKIVLFVGINDENASIPPDTILRNIIAFAERTREIHPDCQILLLSNSVSVSRKHNFEKIIELNRLYKKLAEQYDNVVYVDVLGPMLDHEGKIRPELYTADSTHMNPLGYSIWRDVVEKYL